MDYRKIAEDILVDDVARAENETATQKAAEIRLLSDLELVLAGGGDGTVSWP